MEQAVGVGIGIGAAFGWAVFIIALVAILLIIILPSIRNIGPTEVGLVKKKFGKGLSDDNPVAFKGEAGYQAVLL